MNEILKIWPCLSSENQAAILAGIFTLLGVVVGYWMNNLKQKKIEWPDVEIISSAELESGNISYGSMESVHMELNPKYSAPLRGIIALKGLNCSPSESRINLKTFYFDTGKNKNGSLFSFSFKYFYRGFHYRDFWIGKWVEIRANSHRVLLYGPYYSRLKYYLAYLKLKYGI